MDDHRELATGILAACVPLSVADQGGLDDAIRLEMLLTALQDVSRPRTLADLWHVLERIARGEVALALLEVVRERASQEPDLLLADLAGGTHCGRGTGK